MQESIMSPTFFRNYLAPRKRSTAKPAARPALSMESLEDRRLMAADAMNIDYVTGPSNEAAFGAPTVLTSPATPLGAPAPATRIAPPVDPPAFDQVLSARVSEYGSGQRFLLIDGSDYDDRINILEYNGSFGLAYARVQLEQWSGATQISSQEVRIDLRNPLYPLAVANGAIVVNGKGGHDTINNLTAKSMNAAGGDGRDTIYGGSGGDYISGQGGDDTLYGRGGADLISGDGGVDHINGNEGDDQLFGGDQMDFIYGNAGSDKIWGDGGDDFLYGDNGNDDANVPYVDYIQGGSGNDRLQGDAGGDYLYGEGAFDTLFGGRGIDWMYGGDNDDTMYGGLDGDHMCGDAGVDTLFGEAGNDYLDGGFMSDGNFNSPDKIYGGLGADQFWRHKTTWGQDDTDKFFDFLGSEGDTVENSWHW
jgi:Ca2+-binding RTX toxin-like protein